MFCVSVSMRLCYTGVFIDPLVPAPRLRSPDGFIARIQQGECCADSMTLRTSLGAAVQQARQNRVSRAGICQLFETLLGNGKVGLSLLSPPALVVQFHHQRQFRRDRLQ